MPDSSTGSGIDMKIKTEEPCGWSRCRGVALWVLCAFWASVILWLSLGLCLAASSSWRGPWRPYVEPALRAAVGVKTLADARHELRGRKALWPLDLG
jgi:hypothetical protein